MTQPNKAQLKQFQKDRQLLPYNDTKIAKKMNVGRANYSKYVNERITITKDFLSKFYNTFGDELKVIKEQLGPFKRKNNTDPDLLANLESRLIKRIDTLEQNQAQMLDEYVKRIERLILPLISKTEKEIFDAAIAEANKKYRDGKDLEKQINKQPPKKKTAPPKKTKPK